MISDGKNELELTSHWPERAEVSARRALLKQQTELLGEELPWLFDPGRIPPEAVGPPAEGQWAEQCFNLAIWVLAQVAQAAHSVQHKLLWEETFDDHKVTPELRSRVRRSVAEPVSRHAPGIFAMCEIVAATPEVATRESVPPSDWGTIARRTEKLGVKISRDGTDLQVLIRNYLRRPPQTTASPERRLLDSALLKLDDETGLTSVTPIDDLISVARTAVAKHIRPPQGACVALLANAPVREHASTTAATMYSAIWSAYAAAANELIFPSVTLSKSEIPAQAEPDPHFAVVIDALAKQRAEEWRLGYPAKIWGAAKDEIETMLAQHVK